MTKSKLQDPVCLSDADLSRLLAECRAESERRTLAIPAWNANNIFAGHEVQKRAILVAAAGGHSIMFFGSAGIGKTLLRSFARHLGVAETYECRPCECGFLNDPLRACTCTPADIKKYRRDNWYTADICIEVHRVRDDELKSRATPLEYYTKQLARIEALPIPTAISPDALGLLSMAVSELGLTMKERQGAIAVGGSIARLDSASRIEAMHIAEAVQYRFPRSMKA